MTEILMIRAKKKRLKKRFPHKRLSRYFLPLLAFIAVSCDEEPTYEQTLTGSWQRGGNELIINADSTYYAYCEGYCWARDGKEGRYKVYPDTLGMVGAEPWDGVIVFSGNGDYVWRLNETASRVRFRIMRSQLAIRDDFLVGVWDRTDY